MKDTETVELAEELLARIRDMDARLRWLEQSAQRDDVDAVTTALRRWVDRRGKGRTYPLRHLRRSLRLLREAPVAVQDAALRRLIADGELSEVFDANQGQPGHPSPSVTTLKPHGSVYCWEKRAG